MEDRDVILKKEVLDTDALMKLFGVGRTTASKKMKEIRFVSDRLGISGIIHRDDYFDYLNRFKNKDTYINYHCQYEKDELSQEGKSLGQLTIFIKTKD